MHIRNYKIYLIGTIIFLFISCSQITVKINLHDFRTKNSEEGITLFFSDASGRQTDRKIYKDTEYLKLRPDMRYFGSENSNSFLSKIELVDDDEGGKEFEIYLYDKCNVKDDEKYYTVLPVENSVAYFVEYYDEQIKKNVVIISRDNYIDKKVHINENKIKIEDIISLLDHGDYAFSYKSGNRYFKVYNGLIVKGVNNSYISLSTYP